MDAAFLHVESAYPARPSALPPLLLIHGAANGAWVWRLWLPELAARGWEAHALDLRGHGESALVDLTRTTMDDYVADVATVASAVEGG